MDIRLRAREKLRTLGDRKKNTDEKIRSNIPAVSIVERAVGTDKFGSDVIKISSDLTIAEVRSQLRDREAIASLPKTEPAVQRGGQCKATMMKITEICGKNTTNGNKQL